MQKFRESKKSCNIAGKNRNGMETKVKREIRLKSLDALRGFDMLFIMGLTGWVIAVCNLFPACDATEWVTAQMSHVKWHGLAHHDTIFPLFLFVAGISFPFSIAKQRANGKSMLEIYCKIMSRGIILVLLGFVYNDYFKLDLPNMRYASVLGRIGLAWMFAALLFTAFRTKICVLLSVVILIGYWLMLWLIPNTADPFSQEGNLVGMIDRVCMPGRLLSGTFDPEGLFSTLPAIVTALLGMFTGRWVQLPHEKVSGNRKVLYMLAAALLLALVGWLWSYVFPVNKKLWTSTFVCLVAGYSLFLFAVFYYIIDVKGFSRWSFFFRVVGLNSITIYLAQRIIPFRQISDFFLVGVAGKCPEAIGSVILATGYISVCWLFLYFLYRKNIFLKV
jgi:predicted acyltransferase